MPRRRLRRPWAAVLRPKERLWFPPCASRTGPRSPSPTPEREYRMPCARGYLNRSSPPNRWGRGRDKDWPWPTPPSYGGTEERYGSTLNWQGNHIPHSHPICQTGGGVIMAKRILFVDDEAMVLAGLKRSLRPMREEWEMVFAAGGEEALAAIDRQAFDIIVTDMRMPGMDGAQLLEEVQRRSPQTLRMVLSGQSDRETIMRSVNPAHQFVSKPCEGEELKSRLIRAFALKDLLQNPDLRELVTKLDYLPSLPQVYLQLNEELRRPEPSLQRIDELIGADMAMTAKILKLVNSAFFCLPCEISSASRAVQFLGLDTLRTLVLTAHVFERFQSRLLTADDVQQISEHSLAVSNSARKIAIFEHASQLIQDQSFTTGLLHDAGKLILASTLGEQ